MLLWETAMLDVDSMLAHFALVNPMIDALLENSAVLERLEVSGPAGHIEQTKAEGDDKSKTEYFSIDDGFVSRLGPDTRDKELVSLHPHFHISNWADARPIMQEFVGNIY